MNCQDKETINNLKSDSENESKSLRFGFTTGSAATAATAAALLMLLTGKKRDNIEIVVPAGENYSPAIYGHEITKEYASCYVVKESGDDPDITSGIKIFSKVSYTSEPGVFITGGKGIGVVTRPGLDQGIGEYAINSVPRKMITEVITEILSEFDVRLDTESNDKSINNIGIKVEISAENGEEIAKKTFNPHMGIEGGISIIGTSGIVKPMSSEALIETIKLDIKMQHEEGKDTCIIVPGNYGVTFLNEKYGYDEKDIVLCSNYVGDSIRFAVEEGFDKILFCSHIGKMIKVSGGILNTHSKYGDRRMELMSEAFLEACNKLYIKEIDKINLVNSSILEQVSTTAALDEIAKNLFTDVDGNEINMICEVSKIIVEKTVRHLNICCESRAKISCILYENKYGELYKNF